MRTKTEFCHSCKIQRTQAVLGMMPVMFTEGDAKPIFKKALVCSECGDINYEGVNNSEIRQAHKRYLKTLVDLELETEESVRRKADVEL